MKFYDKDLYKKGEAIQSALLVIIIFIIGFAIGAMSIYWEKQSKILEMEQTIEMQQNKIGEQFIELDSLRETVYMYNMYYEKKVIPND